MNLIDKQYTKTPFYGVEKMTAHLIRNGYPVNVKRIRRLYHIMDIEAIYPKRLSIPSLDYKYPYLLKNLIIDRPNFVWCADISVPQKSSIKDESRSLAAGLQEQAANHHRRLGSKA
ncbi:MAG: IS3 family transposase [Thermoplasmata archaeon]